jgi:hypothetical protein
MMVTDSARHDRRTTFGRARCSNGLEDSAIGDAAALGLAPGAASVY